MNALEAAALIGVMILPFHFLLQHLLRRLPEHVRAAGAVVDQDEALEERGEVIGFLDGRAIYAWVRLFGMTYRFDRVAPGRRSVGPRELLLAPGLLYITGRADASHPPGAAQLPPYAGK